MNLTTLWMSWMVVAVASQDQTGPLFVRYFGTPSKAKAPPHATQWLTHSSYNEDCNDIIISS